MRKRVKIIATIGLLAVGALILGACNTAASSTQNEQNASLNALQQLLQSQPVPQFKYSQIRQTLIDIETAQAHTTQTTSFFFNQGVQDPVQSCPSIGFPVASTSEITNPWQDDNNGPNGNAGVAIGQIDPNGVYAGNSTGTYVLCINPDGTTFADYWEGFVQTVSGPAVWNAQTHKVEMTGPSSAPFKVVGK